MKMDNMYIYIYNHLSSSITPTIQYLTNRIYHSPQTVQILQAV